MKTLITALFALLLVVPSMGIAGECGPGYITVEGGWWGVDCTPEFCNGNGVCMERHVPIFGDPAPGVVYEVRCGCDEITVLPEPVCCHAFEKRKWVDNGSGGLIFVIDSVGAHGSCTTFGGCQPDSVKECTLVPVPLSPRIFGAACTKIISQEG